MTDLAILLLGFAAIGGQLYILTRRESSFDEERREWARERAALLNRIKPETAQPVPGEPTYPSPRGVVPDDDEAFWRAHGIDTTEVR